MSEESPQKPANLDMDLAQIFMPDWAKESGASEKLTHLVKRHGNEDRPDRPARDFDRNRGKRPPTRDGGGGRPGRRDARPERRNTPPPVMIQPLTGWKIQFLPDPRGVDGLARQIKSTAKTFPLFELAQLILEKPERFLVELNRLSESSPELFQLKADGSVWLSEREAIAHAMSKLLDKFYRRERVQVEPPKGAYPFVAVCGMSGVLLGPPNYHDYQNKVKQLHAERFKNISFDSYKSRIRMVRDEESIQKWKDEQSSKDEFYPLDVAEGTEPEKLGSLSDVEAHFRKNYAADALLRVGDQVEAPGEAIFTGSASAVRLLAQRNLEELRRFPLPLAHTLGHKLTSKGLQIFKAHQNITYVSIARPRYLDRQKSPVSSGLSGILDYLESHSSKPRAEQWKALIELRPVPVDGTEKDREAAVVRDLSWLLHEGHVIDYARRGLEASRRPETKQ